jgi:hypothetical protein
VRAETEVPIHEPGSGGDEEAPVQERRDQGRPDELGLGALGSWAAFAALVVVVVSTLVLYGTSTGHIARVVAVGGLVSAGSLASASAVGFLFALPRSHLASTATLDRESGTVTVRPNTNLEDVSDWLTKIIVALTLTQLGSIPPRAGAMFTAIGDAMGGGVTSATFAGALVIFSGAVGFTLMWLVTRVYVLRFIRAADAPLVIDARRSDPVAAGGSDERTREHP